VSGAVLLTNAHEYPSKIAGSRAVAVDERLQLGLGPPRGSEVDAAPILSLADNHTHLILYHRPGGAGR